MTGIRLSPSGSLRWFRSVPSDKADFESADGRDKVDWQSVFPVEFTGIDLDLLQQANWRIPTPDGGDDYAAWEGRWPGTDIPLRIHAAAFRGKPIFFEVIDNYELARHQSVSTADGWLYFFVDTAVFVLAFVNYKRGLGDKRAARRLAVYVFVVSAFANLCLATLPPVPMVMGVLINVFSKSCAFAGWIWLQYIAIEPYTRKYWPEVLLSWSRVFHGNPTSPRIGRDILVGSVFAVAMACVLAIIKIHGNSIYPINTLFLEGTRSAFGEAVAKHLELSSMYCYGICVFLIAAAAFMRRRWLAISMVLLILVVPRLLDFGLHQVYGIVLSITLIVCLLRFGLFSLLVAVSLLPLYECGITFQPDDRFFAEGLLLTAILLAVPSLGFFISQGRRLSFF